MKCVSVSFRGADISVRGKLAFTPEECSSLREELGGCVILCTCCRTEIYLTGDIQRAIAALSDKAGTDIAQYIRIYDGEGAMRHLFRVACGADSAILGEDEILRQVKEAYAQAKDPGAQLNTVFQAAVTCAKRIKTETALSKTPVSAATVAANEAARWCESPTVLMIGASGKIGSAALKNLAAHKNVKLIQTVHIHAGLSGAECIDYADRYDVMNSADCVISATSSPHLTITAGRLSEVLRDRKPRLFIDLAVPQDIDRAVGELDGVKLLNIDDINALARHGSELRLSAAQQAEGIISEELDETRKKLAFREFLPHMERVRERAAQLSFDELIYHLRDELDAGQFAALLGAMEKLGA